MAVSGNEGMGLIFNEDNGLDPQLSECDFFLGEAMQDNAARSPATVFSKSSSSDDLAQSSLSSSDDKDSEKGEPAPIHRDPPIRNQKYHPIFTGIQLISKSRLCSLTDLLSGAICNSNGQALPKDTTPLPDMCSPQDWSPFNSKVDFELMNFLYRRVQMSAGDIDIISHLWYALHEDCKCLPPFQDHQEMYDKIDTIAAIAKSR